MIHTKSPSFGYLCCLRRSPLRRTRSTPRGIAPWRLGILWNAPWYQAPLLIGLVALGSLVLPPTAAPAAPPAAPASPAEAASVLVRASPPAAPEGLPLADAEVGARLAFLEARLDAGQPYAQFWWRGWLTFYSMAAVVQGVRGALADQSRAERADMLVGAAKSLAGAIDHALHRVDLRHGRAPFAAYAATTPAERAARLEAAEAHWQRLVAQAEDRSFWLRHVLNVAANVGGALVVHLAYDDPKTAWLSAGLGIAVGEAHIWSEPWRAPADWRAYRAQFPGAPGAPP